jgi:eukaryotic-like serine/threonine-protein kinase
MRGRPVSGDPAPADRDPVEELAEEFLDRHRRGEWPSPSEYAARLPDRAAEIRELFPFLLGMEDVRPDAPSRSRCSATGPVAPEGEAPDQLGDYRIVREIGRGGMGVVYEAEQVSLGRRVALKVLATHLLRDPTQVQRFEREARAAARLHHTNIVPVFGVGEQDGRHYYVMQLIDGQPLDAVLRELRWPRFERSDAADLAKALSEGRLNRDASPNPSDPATTSPGIAKADAKSNLSPLHIGNASMYARTIARFGLQAADALEYAARRGIVHRDIKPSNLLLDSRGNIWVADFGLAKAVDHEDLTSIGEIVGTIRYMAPERFRGRSDPRCDLYALGITLYELLTLRPAFAGPDKAHLIEQVLRDEPPRPRSLDRRIPRDLETIILKAMAKEPTHRYSSAGELADDLRRFIDDQTIQARRVGPVERAWRWSRRNALVSGLAASLLLVLIVALAGMTTLWRRAERKAAAEQRAMERVGRLVEIETQTRARSQRLSSNLALDRGIALGESDEASRGLHWMVEALRTAPEDATNLRSAAMRNVAAWSVQVPTPLASFPVPEPIVASSIGPDGRVALIGSHGALTLWDRTDGRLQLFPTRIDPKAAISATFSPDSRLALVWGSGTNAQLWSATDWSQSGLALDHSRGVSAAAFRPDGAAVLTVDREGMARLWDTDTGRLLYPGWDHTDLPLHIAFRGDGRLVLTGSIRGVVRLWDVASGALIATVAKHPGPVTTLEFSPDGQTCLSGSGEINEVGGVVLSVVATGKPIGVPIQHPRGITASTFRPDGKAVLTIGWDGVARLTDTATGEPLGHPASRAGVILGAAFSPDGRLFITGSEDGTARLWNAEDGRPVGPSLEHRRPVRGVAFGPDARTILTICDDGVARLWDAPAMSPPGRSLPHRQKGPFRMPVAFHPALGILLTGSSEGTAQLWDSATGRPIGPPLIHFGGVSVVSFRPDGRMALTGGVDGALRLWDPATGRPIGEPIFAPGPITAVAFRPDSRVIAAGNESGNVRIWEVESRKTLGPLLDHPGSLSALAFSPDGQTLAAGTGRPGEAEGTIRLWDVATGRPIGDIPPALGSINRLEFSPSGTTLLVVPERGSAHLRDACNGRPIGIPFSYNVWTAMFRSDGRAVLTGSHDKTARLWDAATGEPMGAPMAHDSAVLTVAFSPDGRSLATGSADKTARLWDASTSKPIGPALFHAAPVRVVVFSPSGNHLLTSDGVPRLWDLREPPPDTPDRVLAQITTLTGLKFLPEAGFEVLDGREGLDTSRAISGPPTRSVWGPLLPAETAAWHDRIAASLEIGGSPFAALWHLDRLIRERPDDALLRVRRARVQDRIGDRAQFDADLDAALSSEDREPVRNALVHWGIEAFEEGSWESVVRLIGPVLDDRPKWQTLRVWRAEALARLGRWSEAVADLAGIDPGTGIDGALSYRLAIASLRAGDSDRYRSICSAALHGAARETRPSLINSAAWLCVLGPNAVEDLDAPVKLSKSNLEAASPGSAQAFLNTLGAAFFRAGRPEDGVAHVRQGIERGGIESPQGLAFLAMGHASLGRREEARHYRDRLDSWRPDPSPGAFWTNQEIGILIREAELAMCREAIELPSNVFAP